MTRVSSLTLQRKCRTALWVVVRTALIVGICFVILYPLLEKLSMTFKSEWDLYDPTVNLLPKDFNVHNYTAIIEYMNYWERLLKTLFLCTGTALLTTLSTTMVGYGFAKYRFRGHRFLFICVMVAMIVPPQTIMMSQFLNMRFFSFFGLTRLFGSQGLNLTDSPASLFLMSAFASGIKNAFFIFIMRQYFKGFPNELSEAASIDGAGHMRVFLNIMLPSAITMMVTVFLFMFVWQWNDNYFTLMLTGDYATISRGLSMLNSTGIGTVGGGGIVPSYGRVRVGMLLVTGEMLSVIPLIILYLFGQKFLVEGVERSGLVG